MGKKRKAPGEKSCHTRPENAASAPEAEDHERYYSQNAALQLDMGSLATAQLGLQVTKAAEWSHSVMNEFRIAAASPLTLWASRRQVPPAS